MDARVERGMRRQLAAAPGDRIGWKMALNAPPVMDQLGLDEPAVGWLTASGVAEAEHSLAGATRPAVEPELLLEAGAGTAVARIGVALEVVDFDRPLDDVEEVIAANVFHRAVACSPLVAPVAPGEARFEVNGDERPLASAPDDPARTLAFVSGFLGRVGARLAPGQIVIAGALAPAAPVAAGDVAALQVRGVGSVSLRFTE